MDQKNKFAEQDFENAVDQNRRRRVYARKPKSARDLINVIIVRRGIAAEQANGELQHAWNEAVGIELASQTRVGSIRRGTLEVIVSNSSLLQMLSFEQNQLLKKMNHQRKAEIKNLRFRIGNMD